MISQPVPTPAESEQGFYVTGGTLRRDAPSYVARRADEDLYNGLTEGRFCYVLTPRQMGKSSLMVRTAARLREAGVNVAVLDLTAIGKNLTAEQWYDGLLGELGHQINLEDQLEDFCLNHERLGPLQRWMRAIREVVLPLRPGRVVIFLDEIDSVRSLPFSTDEFFAGIREFYNRRTEDPEMSRLTFCLLGVATPSDLIRDTRTTPFNIGQRIELNDFNETEAAPLARGLGRDDAPGAKLLQRILYWTGGHPYLTQRLCLTVAEDRTVDGPAGVDRLCEGLFLSHRARERDDNLLFVRERLLRSEADLAALLDLYSQVRKGKPVLDQETSPFAGVLRLSGVVRVADGHLKVRNRIYERVFDSGWVKANMPDAELQRQRAAYRKGLVRATAVAGVVVAVIASLAFYAFTQSSKAREAARRADLNLQQANANAAEAEKMRQLAEIRRGDLEKSLSEAESQRRTAVEQRLQALRQQRLAEEMRQQALEQKTMAAQGRDEIQRLIDEANAKESIVWEKANKVSDDEGIRLYLESYPTGRYVDQAKARLGDVTTGSIAGVVYVEGRERTPIPGARITAINEDTGNTRVTRSDADGKYLFPYLQVGRYTIKFSHKDYESGPFSTIGSVKVMLNRVVEPLPGGRLRKKVP
jgi:hypothetical protein